MSSLFPIAERQLKIEEDTPEINPINNAKVVDIEADEQV